MVCIALQKRLQPCSTAELITIPHLPALYQRVKYRSTREGGGASVAMTTSGGLSLASEQRSSSIPLVQELSSGAWEPVGVLRTRATPWPAANSLPDPSHPRSWAKAQLWGKYNWASKG